jgi:hypothetical protein
MSEKVAEAAESVRKQFAGPMTDEQVQFLRDMQATIEYAISNRFSFPMIITTLAHDVYELQMAAFRPEAVEARGVKLKVPVLGKWAVAEPGSSLAEDD